MSGELPLDIITAIGLNHLSPPSFSLVILDENEGKIKWLWQKI